MTRLRKDPPFGDLVRSGAVLSLKGCVLVLGLEPKVLACFQIGRNKFIPRAMSEVIHHILLFHSANARTLFVDGAASVMLVIVSANSIATIEEACFFARVDLLATQAALSARKGFHIR